MSATANPREILTRPAPPPDATVSVGPGPDQVADLRFGPSAEAPVIILIHGGFWRSEIDRAHLGPLATALAAAGHTVIVPEFRRTGQPGGGWPGTFDDIAAAIDAVPGLLAGRADTGRIALMGHSAGGHLALWAAARPNLPAASPWHRDALPGLRGVIALAPCADLRRIDELGLDDGAAAALMGGPATDFPDRYALADPALLLPLGTRLELIHGTADDRVPVGVSDDFAAAAKAAGDGVTLTRLEGVEHFAVIDPLSPAWPVVTDAIARTLA